MIVGRSSSAESEEEGFVPLLGLGGSHVPGARGCHAASERYREAKLA